MRSQLVFWSLLVTLCAPAWVADRAAGAQDVTKVPARERVGFEAIREVDLRADLNFLTSDALAGRMSLQPGDDAAAAWVASEFAKAGLVPAAKDVAGKPSYLQAIDLIEYKPDRAATTATLKRGGSEVVWHGPQGAGGDRCSRQAELPAGDRPDRVQARPSRDDCNPQTRRQRGRLAWTAGGRRL